MKTAGMRLVRVAAVENITSRVKRFTLVSADGDALPAFSAGSHIVVHLSEGRESETPSGKTWRNSYSLTSAPGETGFYQIAVRREDAARSKGGSIFLHEAVRVGDTLQIEAPANFFPLARQARKHVLIAGGIGITPFLSYLTFLKATRADYELHYAFRDWSRAAFAGLICAEHGNRSQFYVSAGGERPDPAEILAGHPLGTHVYVCGPYSLIDAVVRSAREAGWPDRNVHFEEFTPAPAEHSMPFTAVVPSAGAIVRVEGGQSLLAALENAGLGIASSCRVGRCGTCELTVLEGEPEHRDRCLTDLERSSGRMLACVSRSRGERLVLEVATA